MYTKTEQRIAADLLIKGTGRQPQPGAPLHDCLIISNSFDSGSGRRSNVEQEKEASGGCCICCDNGMPMFIKCELKTSGEGYY